MPKPAVHPAYVDSRNRPFSTIVRGGDITPIRRPWMESVRSPTYQGALMPEARLAQPSDLEGLLDLFRASEVSAVIDQEARAIRIWSETFACEGVAVFVSEGAGKIASTCMLITAPNLLRGGRAHAYLDNVVTRPELTGRGHGRAVVEAALAEAWARDCYHVLLQSGRKDARVHRFYEKCGFEPGHRIGYVAHRHCG